MQFSLKILKAVSKIIIEDTQGINVFEELLNRPAVQQFHMFDHLYLQIGLLWSIQNQSDYLLDMLTNDFFNSGPTLFLVLYLVLRNEQFCYIFGVSSH